MRRIVYFILIMAVLSGCSVFFVGCSSIDCPLNSRVYATYRLVGATEKITDTLTITTPLSDAEGNDSVLINQVVDVDSVSLPMSYARTADTFYFRFNTTSDTLLVDTVVVTKQNYPHFEAVDCNPAFYHTITDVNYTQNAIEKIEINNTNVTYNADKAHLIVYLKERND